MRRKEWVTVICAKAMPSDVGHGRIRISGTLADALDDKGQKIKPGDCIEIVGERATAAIYWRSRPEDSVQAGLIRVDGIIRRNAGISVGGKLKIRKVGTPKDCEQVVLNPVMDKRQKVRFIWTTACQYSYQETAPKEIRMAAKVWSYNRYFHAQKYFTKRVSIIYRKK